MMIRRRQNCYRRRWPIHMKNYRPKLRICFATVLIGLARDLTAIGYITDAAFNAQPAVQRKQRRQSRKVTRINRLVAAGPVLGAPPAVIAVGFFAERIDGGV